MSPWRLTPLYHFGPIRLSLMSTKPAAVNQSMYSCSVGKSIQASAIAREIGKVGWTGPMIHAVPPSLITRYDSCTGRNDDHRNSNCWIALGENIRDYRGTPGCRWSNRGSERSFEFLQTRPTVAACHWDYEVGQLRENLQFLVIRCTWNWIMTCPMVYSMTYEIQMLTEIWSTVALCHNITSIIL